MKRTPLNRKKPLQAKGTLRRATGLSAGKKPLGRGKPLRSGRAAVERLILRQAEPGRDVWKAKRYGRCAACLRYGRLIRHHVLLEQAVRHHTGADPWDLRNALDLGADCRCHANHHQAFDGAGNDLRLPFRLVPPAAIAFAVETIGEGPALNYFQRRYRGTPDHLPKGARCQ
jgi:hypothetical protein